MRRVVLKRGGRIALKRPALNFAGAQTLARAVGSAGIMAGA